MAIHLNLKPIKQEGEVKKGLIIMTKVDTMEEINQVVETDSGDHTLGADLTMDKISEKDILGEETAE